MNCWEENMIQNDAINVMISSRNSAEFDGKSLTEIRKELKKIIESEKIFGEPIFRVWINEHESPQSFNETIWNKCLDEARKADIILVLYNGESGWVKPGGSIGICHAEVIEAVETARGKVWPLPIGENAIDEYDSSEQAIADREFQRYMQENELFSSPIKTFRELKKQTKEAMQNAVVKLIQRGVFEVSRSKNNKGIALQWKRMDYRSRSNAITKALKEAIEVTGCGMTDGENHYLEINDQKILLIVHGVPDILSISASKEFVGQPFLVDYQHEKLLEGDVIGPLHVIGTHKTVSETQARNTLGFPDATILKDTFGIYVADNIHKIQMVFITQCNDPSSTKHGFQQFRDWLVESREEQELIQRASSRKNIVLTIAGEK